MIFLSIFYHADAAPDRNKIYCLISDLKEKGLLSSNLPTMPFIGSPVMCLNQFDENIDALYVQVNENLKEQYKDETDMITCIIDEVKLKNYASYLLKELAFESDEKLAASVGEEVILQNKEFHDSLILKAVFECESKNEISLVFDQIFNNANDADSDTQDDLESAYCIRKYLVNNNLIDTAIFKVVLKDPNVETDCTTIIKNQFKEAENGLRTGLEAGENGMTTEQVECALKKYRSKNYNDFLFTIGLLSEFNPTHEQKNTYRDKFTKMMLEISIEIAECL